MASPGRGTLLVTEVDPVANHAAGLLPRFKVMTMLVQILGCSDDPFHQPGLSGDWWGVNPACEACPHHH